MTESFLSTIDADKLGSKEGFAELLAASEAPEQLDTEQQGDVDQALDEIEAAQDAEDLVNEELHEDVEQEVEADLDPKEAKSVKYFKEQAAAAQAELDSLKQWKDEMTQAILAMQNGAQQAEGETKEEFEPLDQEAYDKTQKELDAMKQQQTQAAFQNALQVADLSAAQKYPDFTDAYQHIQQQKADEIEAITGVTGDQAKSQAMQFMQQVAWNAFQKQRDIGDTFYSLAQKTGYANSANAPQKAKPSGMNPKAIEKNRGKTEKKPVQSASIDDLSGQDPWALMKQISKPGEGVDKDAFAKLLAQASG